MSDSFLPAPAPAVRGRNWPLAVTACVFIVAVAVTGTYVLKRVMDMPETLVASSGQAARDFVEAIAPAFRPDTQIHTLVLSTLDDIKTTPKLVVLTATINATVDKSSTTTWGFVNWGTTTVRVMAKGNQIQYFVPLDTLQPNCFQYDADAKKLLVTLPRPQLDTKFVSVQSDPAQLEVETANGWAKFDAYSGAPLRDEARAELRDAVVIEGIRPIVRKQAEESGRTILQNLLKPIAAQLRDDVTLEVHFIDEGE